jgi:hypothetical protein
LYKSLDFVKEGRKIKENKMNENEYDDDIIMDKFVQRKGDILWTINILAMK